MTPNARRLTTRARGLRRPPQATVYITRRHCTSTQLKQSRYQLFYDSSGAIHTPPHGREKASARPAGGIGDEPAIAPLDLVRPRPRACRVRPNAGELGQVERSICQHAQGHECGQSAHRAHAAMQGAREGHTAIDMPMTLVWSCSNCSKKAKCSGTSIESDSHVVMYQRSCSNVYAPLHA